MKNINFLWEIPLAISSFIFYHTMKLIIGNLFTIYLILTPKKSREWRVFSEATIKSPLVLPVLMTKGPRWNTHAIIGTLGPLPVKESLSLDINSAHKSAGSWIGVIYSFPAYQTITTLESNQLDGVTDWQTIKLAPGKYTIGLRYYQRSENIAMPALKIDDKLVTEALPIQENINQFYSNLIQRKNWFYLSLHYYIYTLLKLKKYLPEKFVAQEYLPVGAPDTKFVYNYLDKNQNLIIEIAPQILANYQVYFTLYDRSSFPLSSAILSKEKFHYAAMETNGYYLLRIRPKQKNPSVPEFKFNVLINEPNSLEQTLELSVKTNYD